MIFCECDRVRREANWRGGQPPKAQFWASNGSSQLQSWRWNAMQTVERRQLGGGGIESGGSQGRGGGWISPSHPSHYDISSLGFTQCLHSRFRVPYCSELHNTNVHFVQCAICASTVCDALSLLECKLWRRDDYHAARPLSQHLSSAIHYHRIHHSNE